jgi:acetyl esterase/lipase
MRIDRLLALLPCFLPLALGHGALAADKPVPARADVSYGPHPHQLLDVYLPPQGQGPFPVVVWFGGLWKPSKGAPVQNFLPAGCAAVAVETRVMQDAIDAKLSPPVSVCLLDARRAVQFVRLHAAEWKLDPGRIAVGGGSQGALPALYVGCAGERADPKSSDPIERVSTKVTCVAAFRSQPTIDPKQMQAWEPGVEWGAPALGYSFAESLKRREELLPIIEAWSPDKLVSRDSPPIYFENEWGLTQPKDVAEANYKVHSPHWGLGFQKLAEARGAKCYVKYLDHPTPGYANTWDFLLKQLAIAEPQAAAPTRAAGGLPL